VILVHQRGKRGGGIKRTSGCIAFRMAGNSGSEAALDHANVHNRGPEGERTWPLKGLPGEQVSKCILLSGTPELNRPAELYPQVPCLSTLMSLFPTRPDPLLGASSPK